MQRCAQELDLQTIQTDSLNYAYASPERSAIINQASTNTVSNNMASGRNSGQQLDPRIVRVSIEVNGQIKTYEGLYITANGTKYANPLQNECEITIANLDKTTQDYILTQTSPYYFNRAPKTVTVEAGRESYGTTVIYRGNIVVSKVTQPPDVGIVLKCLTGNFQKGNILTRNQPGQATLSQISKQIAGDLGTLLTFQTTDKNISNYNFSGSSLKQVQLLASMGGNITAYIDDSTLVVKDMFVPLNNSLRILSAETGMIGIPEFTEQGIKVTFLLDNKTKLGGGLRIQSKQYPAANGDYVIYKLGFQISNRDTPFYYIAEAARRR